MPIVTDADRDHKSRIASEDAIRKLEEDFGKMLNPNCLDPTNAPALAGLSFDELLRAVPYARVRRDDLEAELTLAVTRLQQLCDRVQCRQTVFKAVRSAAIKAMELGEEFDFTGAQTVIEKATNAKVRAMNLSNSKEIAP